VHKRSTVLRFAVAATILALAAPIWATEIQMKKKEDPKKAQKAAEDEKAKAAESSSTQAGKKNCPENEFNTLEDLFGAAGPLDPATGLPTLPAAQVAAATPAAPGAAQAKATPQAQAVAAAKPAPAPAVEWRAVQATDKDKPAKAEPPKPAPSEEKKKD